MLIPQIHCASIYKLYVYLYFIYKMSKILHPSQKYIFAPLAGDITSFEYYPLNYWTVSIFTWNRKQKGELVLFA